MARVFGPQLPSFFDLVALRDATEAAAGDPMDWGLWQTCLDGEMAARRVVGHQGVVDPEYAATLSVQAASYLERLPLEREPEAGD